MGQIDFGKIISAAAVSTLGVLSLIVVLLGVLAFYFFKGSPEKTKLTVWLTMLIAGGLFAVGFIRQADRAAPQDPGPAGTGTPVPADPVKPAATDIPVPAAPESPKATGTPRSIQASTGTAGVKPFDPSDLTGRWHDGEGYIYDVNATSTTFMYQVYLNGQNIGAGQGSRDGNTLRYGYWSKGEGGTQGTCQAIVAADQRSMSGTCTSGAQSWPMFAER